MAQITVDPTHFRELFPYFDTVIPPISDQVITNASDSADSYIATTIGAIRLTKKLQTRGVYLATAHILYLQLNPNKVMGANMTSASEGSVSAEFSLPENMLERYLSLSTYGMELLVILQTVQPPTIGRRTSPIPYYQGGFRSV